mgnify:FL=1
MPHVDTTPWLGFNLIDSLGRVFDGSAFGLNVSETPYKGYHIIDAAGEIIDQFGTNNPLWDASTNDPDLTVDPTEGDRYLVIEAGTQDLNGTGDVTYEVGDEVVYYSGEWIKITGGSGGLVSWNGRTDSAAIPVAGDYLASQVENDSGVAGTYVSNALDALNTDIQSNGSDIANLQSSSSQYATDITNLQAATSQNEADITNLENSDANQNADISSLNGSVISLNNSISSINSDISDLEAADTNLQSQISSNDVDISALQTSLSNKADAIHTHTLSEITDSGALAGLESGTLLSSDGSNLNFDATLATLTTTIQNPDQFLYLDSVSGNYQRITYENLLSLLLGNGRFSGRADVVDATTIEDGNGNAITDDNGTQGDWYFVGTGGTADIGSGNLNLSNLDLLAHNGSRFEVIPNSNTVTGVTSFQSRTGTVTPQLGDYGTDLIGNDTGLAGTTTSDVLTNLDSSVSTNTGDISDLQTNKITKGGDDDGSALIFGTNDNFPVIGEVNGAEQLRFDTTGLGIGVASPSAKLDVDGGVRLRNLSENTYSRALVQDTDGNLAYRDFPSVAASISQASHGLAVGDAVTLSSGNWVKAQADSENNCAYGVVVEVIDANTFRVSDYYAELSISGHGLGNVDESLYLSQITPGLLTSTEPTAGIAQSMGVVKDTNTILIKVDQPVELTSVDDAITIQAKENVIKDRNASAWEHNIYALLHRTGNPVGKFRIGYFKLQNTLNFLTYGDGNTEGNLKTIRLIDAADGTTVLQSTSMDAIDGTDSTLWRDVSFDTSTNSGKTVLIEFDCQSSGLWAINKTYFVVED